MFTPTECLSQSCFVSGRSEPGQADSEARLDTTLLELEKRAGAVPGDRRRNNQPVQVQAVRRLRDFFVRIHRCLFVSLR